MPVAINNVNGFGSLVKYGGGIIYDEVVSKNEKDAYTYFCNNATFAPMGRGTYGCTVRAILNDGVRSPFKSIRYETYMKPIKEILIKFSYTTDGTINVPISNITSDEFETEVNTQIDIHFKTMNYLQPLCPAVVFAEATRDTSVAVAVLNSIVATAFPDKPVYDIKQTYTTNNMDENAKVVFNTLDTISKKLTQPPSQDKLRLNIVAMELADGYSTLHKLYDEEPDEEKCENLRMIHRYAIIEMAIKSGYSHADFHSGNFMMKLTDGKYFSDSPISFYIIDFGCSVKIPQQEMNLIRAHYEKKEYCQALGLIIQQYNPNMFNPCKKNPINNYFAYPQYYMCYNSASKFRMRNEHIDRLVQSREKQIDTNIREFEQLRTNNTDPSVVYPFLPVSNNLKNKMYTGILSRKVEGGSRRTRRRQKPRRTRQTRQTRCSRRKRCLRRSFRHRRRE